MHSAIETYEQAIEFLYGRINYERLNSDLYSADDFKLDRMAHLLERIGNPHEQLPVVHVAGSKGKGSTAAMIAAGLTARGLCTGLFTSPHVEAFEERMVVDGVTTLSGITANFLMSLAGGLLMGYWVSKGDPFWTYSSGLAGIITASAGNDLYHPLQAMIIGAIGVFIMYKMHYWVERRFKIDDAVGAVAVHGYAGVVGLLICGFMLWGYPSSAYEGYAAISPWGMAIGAVIMFGVLGFLPSWIIALILNSAGKLRIPREAELAGLDYNLIEASKRDQDSYAPAEQ